MTVAALLSCTCALPHRQQDYRFVDCTILGNCPAVRGEQSSSWTAEHESLYLNAIEWLARKEACAGDAFTGRMAFQSERRLKVLCDSTRTPIPWLERDERIEEALAIKAIQHIEIFKKGRAVRTSRGIGVELTVIYYLKAEKAEPIREGTDYYNVVELDGVVEIRWVLKTAT